MSLGQSDKIDRLWGLKGEIVFLNTRYSCAFIKAPDTSQIYGVTDAATIARLAERGNKRLVKFDVLQFEGCRLAVNIELYEEDEVMNDNISPQEREVMWSPAETKAPEILNASPTTLRAPNFMDVHACLDESFPGIETTPPVPVAPHIPPVPLKSILRRPSESRPAETAPLRSSVVSPISNPVSRLPESAPKTIERFREIALRDMQDRSSVFDVQGYPNVTAPSTPTTTTAPVVSRNVPGYGTALPAPPAYRASEPLYRPVANPHSIMKIAAPIESTNGRPRSVFEEMGTRHRPIPENNNRFEPMSVCVDPPVASSERNNEDVSVQEVPGVVERSRIGMDVPVDEEKTLHAKLNEWYFIPSKFNRDEYPFPCGGFVVPSSRPDNMIMVFTRRLGCIVRPEDPNRKGRPYAYFMVVGPENYQAWEYDEHQPPSFKSTKYVNSTEIEMKGFALMAPGRRDDPESEWWAWNDHTGFMRCQSSCARILKKKYKDWEPTCQMVMFDATSIDNGGFWTIKNLSYIDYQFAHKNKVWPSQAYFIEGLRVLDKQYQRNPREEMVFYSEKLGGEVVAKLAHICFKPKDEVLYNTRFGAVVITRWGKNGLGRRYQCLMAAPEVAWNEPRLASFIELSRKLTVEDWDKDMNEAAVVSPEPSTLPYQQEQTRPSGYQQNLPPQIQFNRNPVPSVPWEEDW